MGESVTVAQLSQPKGLKVCSTGAGIRWKMSLDNYKQHSVSACSLALFICLHYLFDSEMFVLMFISQLFLPLFFLPILNFHLLQIMQLIYLNEKKKTN